MPRMALEKRASVPGSGTGVGTTCVGTPTVKLSKPKASVVLLLVNEIEV